MAVAGLYLLLNASFVAAAQILVYVGAVNVLILFAIMLVNNNEKLKPIFSSATWSKILEVPLVENTEMGSSVVCGTKRCLALIYINCSRS